MLDLDCVATQVGFAQLVGASQPAVAKHLAAGTLQEGGTYRQWLLAYSERLRAEAAGRVPSDARERRDLAIARQAEAKAALDEREMYRLDGLILDYDSVYRLLMDWTAVAKNELTRAVNGVVNAIESRHGIDVDGELSRSAIDTACRAVGAHGQQFAQAGGRSGGIVDSEASPAAH